ncbi:hypothetical protein [Desulfovibrio inopinatus]|uniref:hypothetical protein n=1 Tax=Desulfovibrio inopinatus TaxID=102109 RepID=UPI000484049E|nr:hypothetical protein [Desulfovibrio inopinatus]
MEQTKKTIDNIIHANVMLQKFWSNANGWAPSNAASLMSKSRLDRQVSLSKALHIWLERESLSEGELILAWANLGALVEGTLKLFFSVYLNDYLQSGRIETDKNGFPKLPDIVSLEYLKVLMDKETRFEKHWSNFVGDVQKYRNAIHAYKDRELGDQGAFYSFVQKYYSFIKEVHSRLPYPDGYDFILH